MGDDILCVNVPDTPGSVFMTLLTSSEMQAPIVMKMFKIKVFT